MNNKFQMLDDVMDKITYQKLSDYLDSTLSGDEKLTVKKYFSIVNEDNINNGTKYKFDIIRDGNFFKLLESIKKHNLNLNDTNSFFSYFTQFFQEIKNKDNFGKDTFNIRLKSLFYRNRNFKTNNMCLEINNDYFGETIFYALKDFIDNYYINLISKSNANHIFLNPIKLLVSSIIGVYGNEKIVEDYFETINLFTDNCIFISRKENDEIISQINELNHITFSSFFSLHNLFKSNNYIFNDKYFFNNYSYISQNNVECFLNESFVNSSNLINFLNKSEEISLKNIKSKDKKIAYNRLSNFYFYFCNEFLTFIKDINTNDNLHLNNNTINNNSLDNLKKYLINKTPFLIDFSKNNNKFKYLKEDLLQNLINIKFLTDDEFIFNLLITSTDLLEFNSYSFKKFIALKSSNNTLTNLKFDLYKKFQYDLIKKLYFEKNKFNNKFNEIEFNKKFINYFLVKESLKEHQENSINIKNEIFKHLTNDENLHLFLECVLNICYSNKNNNLTSFELSKIKKKFFNFIIYNIEYIKNNFNEINTIELIDYLANNNLYLNKKSLNYINQLLYFKKNNYPNNQNYFLKHNNIGKLVEHLPIKIDNSLGIEIDLKLGDISPRNNASSNEENLFINLIAESGFDLLRINQFFSFDFNKILLNINKENDLNTNVMYSKKITEYINEIINTDNYKSIIISNVDLQIHKNIKYKTINYLEENINSDFVTIKEFKYTAFSNFILNKNNMINDEVFKLVIKDFLINYNINFDDYYDYLKSVYNDLILNNSNSLYNIYNDNYIVDDLIKIIDNFIFNSTLVNKKKKKIKI